MPDNAIFFPYINVPSSPWLLRMALYWDELQSIVPYEHTIRRELLRPKMRSLVDSGLVRPIVPGLVANRSDFGDPFLPYAEVWRRAHPPPWGKVSLIHAEKLDRLTYPLMDLGLLTPAEYPWFKMPSALANDFMAFLAASLAQLPEVNADPITNSIKLGLSLSATSKALARDALLESLLPVPSVPDLSVADVVRFKERHGKRARRFRQRLEAECALLAPVFERADHHERVKAVVVKLQDEIDEVAEAMRMTWKDVAFTAVLPILAADATIMSVDWHAQPYAAVAAYASLGVALDQVRKTCATHAAASARPLAYVALAKRQLLAR